MRLNPATSITIDVSPSQLTFSEEHGPPLILPSFAYVTIRDGYVAGVRFKDDATVGANTVVVDVFGETPAPPEISKVHCLKLLLAEGINQVARRSIFRHRPTLIVRGAQVLDGSTAGYARDNILAALADLNFDRVKLADSVQPQWPSPDDRAINYAVRPGLLAGGLAAFLGLISMALFRIAHHYNAIELWFFATFGGVMVTVTAVRILRRSRDPSLYRAKEPAWLLADDPREMVRGAVMGVVGAAICLIIGWAIRI